MSMLLKVGKFKLLIIKSFTKSNKKETEDPKAVKRKPFKK